MLRKTVILAALGFALTSGRASATTLIDLTAGGDHTGSAFVGGGFLANESSTQSTGTGVIDSFLRIQAKGDEAGYNTSLGTPLDDKSPADQYTRALLLTDIPIVNIGGVDYREFLLDINQDNGQLADAILSLNQIQIFQTNSDQLHNSYTGPASGTNAIVGFATATQIFQLSAVDDSTGTTNEIRLNYNLENGSGSGDMLFYVRNSLFNTSLSNVILFSQFGAPPGPSGSNDGFEEWAVLKGATDCVTCGGGSGQAAVPEPASLLLLGTGLGFIARRIRRKKAR